MCCSTGTDGRIGDQQLVWDPSWSAGIRRGYVARPALAQSHICLDASLCGLALHSMHVEGLPRDQRNLQTLARVGAAGSWLPLQFRQWRAKRTRPEISCNSGETDPLSRIKSIRYLNCGLGTEREASRRCESPCLHVPSQVRAMAPSGHADAEPRACGAGHARWGSESSFFKNALRVTVGSRFALGPGAWRIWQREPGPILVPMPDNRLGFAVPRRW